MDKIVLKKKIPLVFALLFGTLLTANANNNDYKELLKRYDNRFGRLDTLIFSSKALTESDKAKLSMPTIVIDSLSPEVPDSLIFRKVDEQINAFMSKTGLQITGQAYWRPEKELGISDEDDAVSRYRAKIQTELRWYYFQSSLFQRKGQINELRIKGEMERLKQEKEYIGMLHSRQQEAFQARYDSLLYSVLTHRIENLKLLSETHLYLLDNENISTDELLDILNDKAEAERMLASIPVKYEACGPLPSIAGMLVDIDVAGYMDEVRRLYSDLNLLELEIALLEQQKQNTTYLSEVRAAPFVRYSHYTRSSLSNSQNIDVGMTFIFPISKEASRKRRVLDAEKQIVAAKRETTQKKVEEEVQLILEDVARNNRLMQGEMVRLKELKNYLGIRINGYENRMGEYSRLARTKEYNSYLKCLESLLRYQFLRDSRLADLQIFLGHTPIQKYCRVSFMEY